LRTQNKRRAIGAAITAVLAAFGLIAYLNVGTASADESTCTPLTGFEQPLCDADAAPPSEEELSDALQTNRDSAVFWTGRVNGQSVEQRAADFADSFNGTTLEQALLRAEIVMPVFADRTKEAVEAWELASTLFAEQASGTAFVVMGPELRPGNVFETLEFPALKTNPDIERVVRVDAETEQETEIFNRDENDPGEDIPDDGDDENDKRDPGPAISIALEADQGKCVDDAEGENGKNLTLQACNGTDRQKFIRDGEKLVTAFNDNLCLSAVADERGFLNDVVLEDCANARGWRFDDQTKSWSVTNSNVFLFPEGRSTDIGTTLEVINLTGGPGAGERWTNIQ
jgi:hypothetical protein